LLLRGEGAFLGNLLFGLGLAWLFVFPLAIVVRGIVAFVIRVVLVFFFIFVGGLGALRRIRRLFFILVFALVFVPFVIKLV